MTSPYKGLVAALALAAVGAGCQCQVSIGEREDGGAGPEDGGTLADAGWEGDAGVGDGGEPDGPWSPAAGLFGGKVFALQWDAHHPDTLWAGTHGAGVFKSTDRGHSWERLVQGLEQLAVIGLFPDPAVPGRIYAEAADAETYTLGWGEQASYRSDDGGQSWTRLGAYEQATQVHAYQLAPAAGGGGRVYARTSLGMYRSDDEGASWVQSNSGLPSGARVWSLALDPTDADILWVVSANQVFRSANGGTSWVAQPTPTVPNFGRLELIVVDPHQPARMWLGGINMPFHHSVNAGASWQAQGQLVGCNPEGFRLSHARTQRAFLPCGSNSPQFTDDFGATWARLPARLGPNLAFAVAPHPEDPDLVLVGTFHAGVVKSVDLGNTWGESNQGLTNVSVTALALAPSDAQVVVAGAEGGHLYLSDDGARTFLRAPLGPWGEGAEITALAVHPLDPDVLLISCKPLGLAPEPQCGTFKSIDRGQSFAQVSLPSGDGTGLTRIAFHPLDAQRVWAANGNNLFKSDDGGVGWTRIAPPFTVADFALDPTFTQTVYALSSRLWVSADAGASWQELTSGISWGGADLLRNTQLLVPSPTHSFELYAGVVQNASIGLLKRTSSTGGWIRAQVGLPETAGRFLGLVAAPGLTGDVLYAAAHASSSRQRVQLFTSTDGALSWSERQVPGLHQVTALAVDPLQPERLLVAERAGLGVRRTQTRGE
jgi:photosystem II stability/assembly factor-like uncharacterized protein